MSQKLDPLITTVILTSIKWSRHFAKSQQDFFCGLELY